MEKYVESCVCLKNYFTLNDEYVTQYYHRYKHIINL